MYGLGRYGGIADPARMPRIGKKQVESFALYMNTTVYTSVTMPDFLDDKFSEKVTIAGETR